ncbi:MAG: hypothetical protein LC781_03110 [Actinobacteria bacterium]|nr:hypothetical protein [Actinomycetota bacterium]
MSLDTMFTFLLLILVVVVAVAVGGAAYIMVTNRRTRRETGRAVGTAGAPAGAEPDEDEGGSTGRVESREPRREFYKSMGLETTEDMKIRVYSVEEYRDELGGTRAGSNGGFVAALKAYRQLDDDWVEYSPRKAADVLELAPEDYEVDEEHSALLLRRLPPGLPESARDVL